MYKRQALDAASGVPLYEQLYESLAAEMRSGAIPAGNRMPGKRRLAAELSVSVNTCLLYTSCLSSSRSLNTL